MPRPAAESIDRTGPGRRSTWALGTFLSAIAFRIALFFSGAIDAVFETGDSYEYRALATSMLEHHVFGFDGIPKMNRTPGYPAFLAALYGTVGGSQGAVTGAQIVVDAITCAMVVDLAVRAKMPRLACLVVAILSVTCLFTAAYSYQVMTETLYTFVLTAAVWVWPSGKLAAAVQPSALWRVAVSGLLGGVATLVRPSTAVTLIVLPAMMAVLLFKEFGRRMLTRSALLSATTYAVAASAVVLPWMMRNRVVFHEEYEKPDHSNVTLLGFKTDVPLYRHFYTADFMAFKRSYEEPMILERPDAPPTIARYVYPGEREDVERAFADLHEQIASGNAPIRAETLHAFRVIAEKRYASAKRLYVTAPISRILKFWIVPRVSVLWKGLHGGKVSLKRNVVLTLYNCIYVFPGLCGLLLAPSRRVASATVAAIALVASQTALYCLWQGMPQSRYAIPFFPILCFGCGAVVTCIIHRYASRRSVAIV